MDEVDIFVAAGMSRLFQIQLFMHGDAENDGARFIALADESFKYMFRIEPYFGSRMDARQIVFRIFICFDRIPNVFFVEQTHNVCFLDLSHGIPFVSPTLL